jgi:hypothetical protein
MGLVQRDPPFAIGLLPSGSTFIINGTINLQKQTPKCGRSRAAQTL